MGGKELSNTEIAVRGRDSLGLGQDETGKERLKLGGKGGKIIRKDLKRVRVTEVRARVREMRVCNLWVALGNLMEEEAESGVRQKGQPGTSQARCS